MSSFPAVSIVIPVYNDPAGIRTTIDSVLDHTTYPAAWECLVVDNGSTDRTPHVIDRYARRHDRVIHETESAVQSSYAARNAGIDRATGDVLVFLDADQRVDSGWLTEPLDRMTEIDVHYLAPNVELDAPPTPSLIARYNLISGFPIEGFLTQHHYAPTSCLFVTRELLDDVGGFDDRLVSGGDLEFGNRVYDAGYDLGYAPDTTVGHPTRNSFRALFERNVRIGRGHCQLQQYYPDRYGRVGIPPRPSGIRREQYDASMNQALYTAIAVSMTAARGLGYYRECLGYARRKLGVALRGARDRLRSLQ